MRDRETVLSEAEERAIINLLLSYAKQGILLTPTYCRDAVLVMITSFASRRRLTLQCRGFTASLLYLSACRKRHAILIKLENRFAEEAKRSGAVNAEPVICHFVTSEQFVVNHNNTADRLFSLDEIGVAPEKVYMKHCTPKRLMPASEQVDMIIAD